MISRWQWLLGQTFRKLWFRAALFAIAAVITALVSILFKSMIPLSVSIKIGAETVDHILNILASSMLAVTTFSLSIMVSAYGSATTNVTPRATRLVVEDVTTQNVLATFIGSFLFSLVGIIALNMGAYGSQGRVILFAVTLIVIALIVITLLRWIQHLTSLGQVGETTATVENAAIKTFINRAQDPFLGGYPWLEHGTQPAGTKAIYPEKTGYVEHIDIGSLAASLADSPEHIYLVAQPGSFMHPSLPAMYVTGSATPELCRQLLSAYSIADARSFSQDPRFCLCVMAEIACRALSPAVNDPGTAIDVIGRAVRILSEYGRHLEQKTEVRYPMIHIAPLCINSLFDDFFSPVARDGAAMREVQIRVVKSLAMLARGWPELYLRTATAHAEEALQYIERENYIDSDKRLISEIYGSLFPAVKATAVTQQTG
ncbi:DUF2254 domain-containing protein [Pantoea sp. FN060301]|uniref:DUF2254 domain-containing protein n=1 Tax=Pantoea sp. FN060301 TaxID=3420380 RepID=UPI003D180DEE